MNQLSQASTHNGLIAAGKSAGGYFSFSRTPFAIPELDGLRAIAVMLVLLRHALHPLQSGHEALLPFMGWDLATPFINGWIGVDLFFVLSGFLISCHLMRNNIGSRAGAVSSDGSRGGSWSWSHYLTARALRIVPTYLFVMAIVIAGLIPLYQISDGALGLRIAYHLLFLQDYLPANFVVSFWSLGVEEKFYLIAPFLIVAVMRFGSNGQKYAALGAIILLPTLFRSLTALGHPEITSYQSFFPVFRSPFHLSFDGLIIGVLCAQIYMDKVLIARAKALGLFRAGLIVGMVLIAAHLMFVDLMGVISWYDKSVQPLAISVGFGLILLSVISGGREHPVLNSRSSLVLARISYPLYLIHLPLVPLAMAMQSRVVGPDFLSISGFAISFISLSIMAALLIHFLVEKPFLLLKDRVRA